MSVTWAREATTDRVVPHTAIVHTAVTAIVKMIGVSAKWTKGADAIPVVGICKIRGLDTAPFIS